MDIKKVIELLKQLEEGTGLCESEHWDGTHETETWRLESIKAINTAVKFLESSDIVGSLEINGIQYKVVK